MSQDQDSVKDEKDQISDQEMQKMDQALKEFGNKIFSLFTEISRKYELVEPNIMMTSALSCCLATHIAQTVQDNKVIEFFNLFLKDVISKTYDIKKFLEEMEKKH